MQVEPWGLAGSCCRPHAMTDCAIALAVEPPFPDRNVIAMTFSQTSISSPLPRFCPPAAAAVFELDQSGSLVKQDRNKVEASRVEVNKEQAGLELEVVNAPAASPCFPTERSNGNERLRPGVMVLLVNPSAVPKQWHVRCESCGVGGRDPCVLSPRV